MALGSHLRLGREDGIFGGQAAAVQKIVLELHENSTNIHKQ